jgi:hypothetical protein
MKNLSDFHSVTIKLPMKRGGTCKMDVYYDANDDDVTIEAITFPNKKQDVSRFVIMEHDRLLTPTELLLNELQQRNVEREISQIVDWRE